MPEDESRRVTGSREEDAPVPAREDGLGFRLIGEEELKSAEDENSITEEW
jgi:hypothetical protein